MTAFATEWTYELHSTSEIASGKDDLIETVEISGLETSVWNFNVNDKLVMTNSTNMPADMQLYINLCARKGSNNSYNLYFLPSNIPVGNAITGGEYDLYKAVEGFWEGEIGKSVESTNNLDSSNSDDTLWALLLSNGTSTANGYIWFRLVGERNETVSIEDYGDWAYDENGWWIQFKDGSYLTNAWWQSPDSKLWYYMGSDGYMVTNTMIDGYTINADGVWVQ